MNDALSINIRILVYAVYYCLDDYVVDCYMLLILVSWCMYVQCLFSPQHKVSNKQQKTSKTIHIWYPPPQTLYIWLLHNMSAKICLHPYPPFVYLSPLSKLSYTLCIVVDLLPRVSLDRVYSGNLPCNNIHSLNSLHRWWWLSTGMFIVCFVVMVVVVL